MSGEVKIAHVLKSRESGRGWGGLSGERVRLVW